MKITKVFNEFFNSEKGGILLIICTLVSLVLANGSLRESYVHLWHTHAGPLSIEQWVNDGLMAIFFLMIGLELKREIFVGELSSARTGMLPVFAAIGGMVVPAAIYLLFNYGTDTQHGFGIPMATDIAFAIGVMAMLGKRVPSSLKLLLTTVAIVDDMGAVAIIALAYTEEIRAVALVGAGVALAVLYVMNRRGVHALWPYLAVGAILWLLVLQSGVHATIAGVATAAFVPLVRTPGAPDAPHSPLHRLEHALHPWVAYAIVPLFAFANAGVALGGVGWSALAAPVVIGVALGLFLGKQIGIFGAIWGAARLGIARRPHGVSWAQIHGMALLAGIGFTMSLFIGGLAFPGDARLIAEVKVGVLAGSLLSAAAGAVVLALSGRSRG